MTTTIEVPATEKTATTETHRVVFSDPYVMKTPPAPDSDAPRGAVQAPVFSSVY